MNNPEFNWLTALEDACWDEPSEDAANALEDAASLWPSCACGQLCKSLPRMADGRPRDTLLIMLGGDFSDAIEERDWQDALATFHAIEARTAELLNQKAVK